MKTNYVLCCWSGARRIVDPRVDADPPFYLRKHIAALEDYKHSLTQITVVLPYNPNEPPAYREYLDQLPETIQGAKVVIFERLNVGLSYGSFSDCYAAYRTEFDYYFFMEDDYIFTQNHFDEINLQVMIENPQCGYLCGMAWVGYCTLGILPYHAGIANGLLRAEALEKVFNIYNFIPHANDTKYIPCEVGGQVAQSRAIIDAGYTLMDWAGKYKVGYQKKANTIVYFHKECSEIIMQPV